MEKKQSGVCDKLFHAFSIKPALQPLRRLTFGHQDPVHSTTSSPPLLAHSTNTDKKHSAPPGAKPQGSNVAAAEKKLHEATANLKADLKHAQDLMMSKVPAARADPAPAQPHKATRPPKKDLNQKMDEFITRTYGKIRTTSGVGKAPVK